MRIASAIILLVSMVGTTFSTNWALLEYALNKKYIVANLCENKDRPELKCEGKCYLCKKITRQNNKDQESSGHRVNFKFQVLSSIQDQSFVFSVWNTNTSRRPLYEERPCTSFSPSFFHPPQA